MLRYEDIKNNERRLQSLTSLRRGEFEYLLSFFSPLCARYFRYHTYEGKRRKMPRHKPQADEKLPTCQDKLFFLLVYLKANPLQEFQAALFDVSQGQVSSLVKCLQALLDQALSKMGLSPCRDSAALKQVLACHPDQTFNQDATERPVPRKTDPQAQKEEYSGKAKDHTAKNGLLSDDSAQILYLSPTYEGKKHDKAICDEEDCQFPPELKLRQDTGYQGYRPEGVTIIQPTRKPRGKELTDQQKQRNRAVSRDRVIVENALSGVKRLRILKDRIRLKCCQARDRLMSIGCALHNLRVKSPCRDYSPRTGAWAL
jgi:hypothetical protein